MKSLYCLPILLTAVCVIAAEPDKAAVEASARKAAGYLLKQQNEDGTFGKSAASNLPGLVGLALKGIVSSPDKPRESNPAVDKAVKYLLSRQLPNGAIAVPEFGQENYNTSIAAVAIAALENPAHKDVLEKARKYILSCQLTEENGYDKDEHDRAYGSFGYGDTKRGDVSNTGFSLEALKALGVKEDSPAWKNAVLFLKRAQDNDETNDVKEMHGGANGGGFVYLPGSSEFGTVVMPNGKRVPRPYGNMTYVAIKSLLYAGVKQDDPSLQAAFKWIRNNYTVKENPGGGQAGYYYYVLAFAKAFTASGIKDLELSDGKKVHWAQDLAAQLMALQKPDGSFINDDKRWMESDSVLSTSYALDALNLCAEAMKN